MEYAIDMSGSRPAPAAIKAAGVAGVMRYVAHNADKSLSAAEAAGYLGAGLWIGAIFEDGQNNSVQGASQGLADVRFADHQLDSIGCPRGTACFYTSDRSVTLEQVRPYYAAVRSSSHRPVGFYGGLGVGAALQQLGLIDYIWVTNAASFSGYRSWSELAPVARASSAVMLQRIDHPLVGIPPSAYDLNEVLRPFPAWGRTLAPPVPVPPPVTHPFEEDLVFTDISMKLDSRGDGHVPVPGIKAGAVGAVTGIATPDPERVGHYLPIPTVNLTIGKDGNAEVVVEGGPANGPATVRVLHQ